MKILPKDELKRILSEHLKGWIIKDTFLSRVYDVKDWKHAFFIAQVISFLAEKSNHHPNLTIKYSQIKVELYTHSVGGITDKDIVLAKEIEASLLCLGIL